jgi:predicted O-methyltransferase YrrM
MTMSAPPDLPEIVSRALDLSRRRGFVSSSRLETGRLLAALAASRRGALAECGTGCGVGAAWLVSAAPNGTKVLTAELDPDLAEAVTELFADQPCVDVVAGDWTSLYDSGPFSLLFLDVRDAKASGTDVVAEMLESGGIVVLDDFTPSQSWPPVFDGRVDSMREQWLLDERFTSVEVMVAPDASVLIATRR